MEQETRPMKETGVVLSLAGLPLYWHLPKGRTAGSLPDSAKLWRVLWENRSIVSGVAHSHPGAGLPSPSLEDLTTFAAVEAALGRRLIWPIVSADAVTRCFWIGPDRLAYARVLAEREPIWVAKLRRLSHRPIHLKETDHEPLRSSSEHHLARPERRPAGSGLLRRHRRRRPGLGHRSGPRR